MTGFSVFDYEEVYTGSTILPSGLFIEDSTFVLILHIYSFSTCFLEAFFMPHRQTSSSLLEVTQHLLFGALVSNNADKTLLSAILRIRKFLQRENCVRQFLKLCLVENSILKLLTIHLNSLHYLKTAISSRVKKVPLGSVRIPNKLLMQYPL